mgnify:FL=1
MSTKLRATTRCLLMNQLKALGEAFLAVIAIFIVIPFVLAVVSGSLSSFSLPNTIANFSWGFLIGAFIFLYNSLTYDNFKLFIQNGISRKTFWATKIITTVIIAVIGELFVAFYRYAISAPIWGISAHAALMKTPYSLYGNFLGSNVWVNILVSILFTIIFFIATGMTGMAIGGGLALLSKWGQRIVIVVVPVVAIFLIGFVGNSSADKQVHYDFTWLVNLLKFLVGYPQHEPAIAGSFSPAVPMITMLIGGAIMAAIAYGFNQLLKVKN